MTMATLQEQLQELQDARASGARIVRFRDGTVEKFVEFKSDTEMVAAIADLERRINANPRSRVTYITARKGI
jgi:hypothetical protein